jgi:hypothetical protein
MNQHRLTAFSVPRAGPGGIVTFASLADHLLDFVWKVGDSRAQTDGVERRLMKSLEELGEVAEVRLNLTGNNGKNKTPHDQLEESVDVFIVLADTLFEHVRHLPGEYQSEKDFLRHSALTRVASLEHPALATSVDKCIWKVNAAVVKAHSAQEQLSQESNAGTVRAVSAALLEAYHHALQLMYTFVKGLPGDKAHFDAELLAMLERKLTKWVTAVNRSSNAVQQAEHGQTEPSPA